MSEPERLLKGDLGAFERELLSSVKGDAPNPRARQGAAIALGLTVGGATLAASGAASAATAAAASAGGGSALGGSGAGAAVVASKASALVMMAKLSAAVVVVGAASYATVQSGAFREAAPSTVATSFVAPATSARPSGPAAVHASPKVAELEVPPSDAPVPEQTPEQNLGAPASELVAPSAKAYVTPPRPAAPPAPPAPSAVAAGSAAIPPASEPLSLAGEAREIEAARQLMVQGNATGALAAARAYERAHPGGVFVPEAHTLRVDALVSLGSTDEAIREAQTYLKRYANGPAAARFRRLVGEEAPQKAAVEK